MKDYYAILEVPPTASQETIREQYLFLIQAWHPDKFRTAAQKARAEEKSKEINIAYGVLKDVQKRAKYDRELGGQPSRLSEEDRRRQTEEGRQRRQAEEAQWRRAEEQRQQRERAEHERTRTEHERQALEAEGWIPVFFEQARRRQSGQPPVRLRQILQHPIRVLVVDDAVRSRARMRELLGSEADIRVVGEASDGRDAISQFEALLPDVTTICIDKPSMDGIAATEAILRKHPIAKIIIISIQADSNYIRRSAMAGACDYLIKPTEDEELLLAIRLAAGRGTLTSEKVAGE